MVRKKSMLNRREIIIDSADRLFNHFGFDKTTMEDIARESGIPRATIYLEFASGKEDVLMACIERYLRQALNAMKELARQARCGRLEALKKAILQYVLDAYDRSTTQHYNLDHIERYSKRARMEMADFFQARLEFFCEILRQAAMGGEIPEDCDFMCVAELLSDGMMPYLPPLANRYSRPVLEKNANTFFAIFLSGLAKNARVLVS